MGSGYLSDPLVFIVNTLFELYILVVLLRFLLQLSRADFYNPISQFLVKATQPVLRPLRRVIPGVGGVDAAAIVLLIVLQLVALLVVGLIKSGQMIPLLPLLVLAVANLLELVLNVYLFAVIIGAILSWVQTGYTPVTGLIDSLTEPVLTPARRLLPSMGGLDLSPLIVIVAIQVIKMLALPPLMGLARAVW